ncbi:mannosylglycerate hydrolase [Candidatus Gastranaerophilus sp. (ex Termes propinquus)]|nr:mannosylglycerate hydrolase [Candidatus Gastranaerophilus sp. (ex Termes propinquus)]
MKKTVYAYLHTHWDREWYRDKEEFNLRLLEVVDEILQELESGRAPCFYFDGQTSALEDYLKFRPEKLGAIKQLIAEKKLFIGPFFVSADSFLTSRLSLEKNLEIGLEYARSLGQNEFIGYMSDTFGHSKGMPELLKSFGINNAIIWRGAPDISADLIWEGINTTRLVQGYFMDVLHQNLPISKRAELLEDVLEKIAKHSGKSLLLPIGADHLAILKDANKTIEEINKYLKNFQVVLSSPFDYLKTVEKREAVAGELLDNSCTYLLKGVWSSRIYQKVRNAKLQWELTKIVEPLDRLSGGRWRTNINYAYKELIKNHAHDSLYGCSTDPVHKQVDARFDRVESVLNGVKKRILRDHNSQGVGVFNLSNLPYSGAIRLVSDKKIKNAQITAQYKGFTDEKLYATRQIPVTEDIVDIYEYLIWADNLPPSSFSQVEPVKVESDLKISKTGISNKKNELKVKCGKIYVNDIRISLSECKDTGDSYNFAPANEPLELDILSTEIIETGPIRAVLRIYFKSVELDIALYHATERVEFTCKINNEEKNHKLSVNFELKNPLNTTVAEDISGLVKREHCPDYSLFKNMPAKGRQELQTNNFPMQRFVFAQGVGVATLGLNDYEIYKNTLSVTLLRATGIISNPKNPARPVPAGPPLETPDLQCPGESTVNFALCPSVEPDGMFKQADEFYGTTVAFVK